MGFWSGHLFGNDHASDVRDALVSAQVEAINAAVNDLTRRGDTSGQESAATSAGKWDAYDRLVELDEQVLAPAAMIAALVDDVVVRAMGPDAEEVQRWRAAVAGVYAEVRQAEEYADERTPTALSNALPRRSAGAEFWAVREQQTSEVFDRLAKAAQAAV